MVSVPVISLLHVGASISWTSFTSHWTTVVELVAMAALYEWQARRGKQNADRASDATSRFPLRASQRVCFYGALLVIFFSLNGWLHDLSDWYLFSAHMVQHLLLTILMPPLLLAGVPGWLLRPLLERPVIGSLARLLTRPKICFAAFSIVVAF